MTYILAATGLRSEARIIARRGIEVIACGGHGDVLSARLSARIAAARPAGLLSIGIAGALDPELRVGDVVTDGDGGWLDIRNGAGILVRHAGTGQHDEQEGAGSADKFRRVIGTPMPAATAAAKAQLRAATGAAAVDMESHVVARVAAAHALPFVVLRVISDTAVRDLPAAACVPLTDSGGVRLGAVLAAVLRDPRQIGALVGLARDTRFALEVLARFRIEALPQ